MQLKCNQMLIADINRNSHFIRSNSKLIFDRLILYTVYLDNNLPAFFIKPVSARGSLQSSHLKQSGCQFACIALITLPITYSPVTKRTLCANDVKSCPHRQYNL